MSINLPPEGDQKSPSLRSGFWRANIVGSFFIPTRRAARDIQPKLEKTSKLANPTLLVF